MISARAGEWKGNAMRYRFESQGQVHEVALERRGQLYQVEINGRLHELEVLDAQPGVLSLRFENRPLILYWAADGGQKWISLDGCTYRLGRPAPRRSRSGGEIQHGQQILSPMPAQIRAVYIQQGDAVEKGQTLLLLEAMKMEIQIKAPQNGVITRLAVSSGQTVEKEQVLVEMGGAGDAG
jgi:acetyl/propionyl-CoA carboxylase alpha subunit